MLNDVVLLFTKINTTTTATTTTNNSNNIINNSNNVTIDINLLFLKNWQDTMVIPTAYLYIEKN